MHAFSQSQACPQQLHCCSLHPSPHCPSSCHPLQVGNSQKQKWLHALGLVPAAEMTPEALQAVPEGTTKCPYGGGKGGGEGGRKRPVGEEEDTDLGNGWVGLDLLVGLLCRDKGAMQG